MFRAVNTEFEQIRVKIDAEREAIHKMYRAALETNRYSSFFEYVVVFEENNALFEQAVGNLKYSYVRNTPLAHIMDEVSISKHRHAYFLYIGKNIDYGNYIKAKRLLNEAARKNWFCNEWYELQARLQKLYFATK